MIHDPNRDATPDDDDDPASARADASVRTLLSRAWAARLHWHYDLVNQEYLGSRLRRPSIEISSFDAKLGEWDASRRLIRISEHHILSASWESVLDTLRHEMAHQWVTEHLGLGAAPPHGDAFRDACRLLRCEPTARATTESLTPLEESSDERDRILLRVRELLALASSPNEHEAANAMRMAQKYLLKYNLSLEELEGELRYETRYLGGSRARVQEWEYTLSVILRDHFFVRVIWTPSYEPRRDISGRNLQICGSPENLDVAEHVFEYVTGLLHPLWRKRRIELRREGRRGTKLQYFAGVLDGLWQKLDLQKRTLATEEGLVWVGDSRLADYWRHLHPRTSTVSTSGVRRNAQYEAGVRDGKEITLRRGVKEPARRRGRELPPPR